VNTLPQAITAQVLLDPDAYQRTRQRWSELVRARHPLRASHYLLYLALMGRDWRKAFTPITNQRKLDNGAFFAWRMHRALYAIHDSYSETELLAPFDGAVTPEMLQQIRRIITKYGRYQYRKEEFTPQSFPFDAYDPSPLMQAPEGTNNA
jgi:hypothetical protein